MKAFNLKQIIGTAINLTTLVILGGGAKLAAQITVEYPNPANAPQATRPTYACVGDTIYVTATADDLIVPVGDYWSGDAYVKNEGGKVTKRFFTYHPYLESNPTAESSRTFDFTIRKDGAEQKIPQAIRAKSCPPTGKVNNPAPNVTSFGNKYNLGQLSIDYVFVNETSKEAYIRIIPAFTPPQPFCQLTMSRSTQKQMNANYRVIQVSDASYAVDLFYNEGDSLNRKFTINHGTYNLTDPLGTLQPDKPTGYCPGNDIVFSLQLGTTWQNVLNQTAGNDIGSCFDWSGSPSPVTYTGKEGDKYFFKTTAAGTSAGDYHCTMKVLIKFANNATANPKIDTSFTHTYDVPVVQPTYNEAKGFKVHEITICQGEPVNLRDSTEAGVTVQEYRDDNNNKITNFAAYVPSQSEDVSAIITSPCAWTDKMKINVIDKSEVYSITPATNTLICAGEAVSFSATANSPISWNILCPGNTANNDSWSETEAGKTYTRTFSDNVIVTATVSRCGTTWKQFTVQVVQKPLVLMNQNEARGCPGVKVSLSGTGGSNPTYTVLDRRTNRDVTAAMSAYITATGLTNYPLRPNDDMQLTYKAGITTDAPGFTPASLTCYSSVEANIIANAQPTVKIRYNGTEYTDGGTACVPRETDFHLTASGADSYIWLDDPSAPQTAQRTLALGNDGLISVRGEESLNGCADTVSLQCLVSVESTHRVKTKTICPGEQFCFEVDMLLPNTTYTWIGPDGLPLDNTTARLCDIIQIKQQKDEGYPYTLITNRNGVCEESLSYTLTVKRMPRIENQTNLIKGYICVGDQLTFNYTTGLPATEHPLIEFTKDGDPVTGGHEGNGDTYLYNKANVQSEDAGRYILTVTPIDLHPCPASDTVDVTVEVPAVVSIENATLDGWPTDTVCEGDQTLLRAEITGMPTDNFIYKWENANRVIYNGPESEIQAMWQRADDGPLYLTVQQIACETKANANVTVIPTPQLSGMPKDTNLCQGQSFCMSPFSDIEPEFINWTWIDKNGTMRAMPQDALPYCLENADESRDGRYFVLVTHVVGTARCVKQSDTTQVTVQPTPDIHIDGPDYICEQSTVILRAVSNMPGTVIWNNNSTDEVIEVSEPGRYEVTRISPYGCQDTAEHYLVIRALPYFSLPPDTSICRGTDIMVYGPDDMDTYFWNDGQQSKDRLVDAAGEYILTVERNGCSFRDSIHIYMTFCGQFHFPTAFSPNDNRVNDTWGAISSAKDEEMAEFDLMVFDRNGKKVFHGKRISEQWDGTYKGVPCQPGVYSYSFKALEKLDGIQYRTNGTVTIVR